MSGVDKNLKSASPTQSSTETSERSESTTSSQLTLFAGDSHASLSPLPGSKEAKKMTVTSGLKCLGLLKSSSPVGLLVKMLVGSSIWGSEIVTLKWKAKPLYARRRVIRTVRYGHTKSYCSSTVSVKTLKKSDTRSPHRLLFQLVPLKPRIEETGSGLWLTPNSMDSLDARSPEKLKEYQERSRPGRTTPPTLREQVHKKLYPTMTQADAHGHEYTRDGGVKGKERLTIAGVAKMWPTPRVGGHEGYETRAKRKGYDTAMSYLESAVEYYERKIYPTPRGGEGGVGMCGGTGSRDMLQDLKDRGQITEEERKAMQSGNGGQLNPPWVEWLMGYPRNWTAEGETAAHDGFDNEPLDIPRVAVDVPDRVNRLKALGNAVLPKIPAVLGRAIMEVEHDLAS